MTKKHPHKVWRLRSLLAQPLQAANVIDAADFITSVRLTKRVIDDDRPGADVSLTLEVATSHGAIHEVEVKPELLITPRAAAKAICNQIGKFPEDDKPFENEISSLRASPVRETRKTKRTGWRLQGWGTDHAFLLPFAAFGPGREIYEVDRSEQVGDLVGLGSTRGTLAQWQRSVAPKLASSTAGVTGAGSVFGSALIAFSEIAEPWAILICGHSSTGKSSLLDGLSSIQGAAKATLTGADSTLQGLHETGALYNDQVMPIGDLSKLGDKDRWDLIRRLAFDLTEGKSRTISASVRQKIPPRSYRCVPIATYEHDTEIIATQVRGQPLAGQAVRCFNFAAPDGPTGHFDRLPTKDKAVSATLAQDLQKASASHYGTAGQAWLSWLVSQDLNWLKSEVASIVSAFQASVQPSQNADALETRAAQKFGLMLAGLNLAKQAGVIDWSGTLMSDCVAQSFESAMRIVGRRSPDSLRASFIQALTDEGLTIDGAKKKSIRKQLRATPDWVSIRTTRKGVPAIGVRRAQMERVMGRSACGEAIDILIREGQAFPDRNSGGWQKDLPGQGKCRLLHVSLDVLKSA